MEIPATSDNIPGTLVLRDSLGRVDSFESSADNTETPISGRGELLVQNTNTSDATYSKIQFRSRDTTDKSRHGASVSMQKAETWVGGSGSYAGHLSIWTRPPSGDQVERVRIKSTGQVRFIPLAADPAGAEAGDVYYNSAVNKLKVYDGTSWVGLH